MTISLCMITKNEEEYLEQSLNSIKNLVDEIIILDTGSKDKTREIAKKFTSHIFKKPWNDSFSEARNESIKHATKDWILVLDADEVLDEEDCGKIKKLVQDDTYDAYTFQQINYTHDTTQFTYTPIKKSSKETKDFPGFISCNIIRLFRNNKNIKFANPVHESVDASIPKDKVKKTDIKIHHYQFERGEENQKEKQLKYLRIYETKINEFTNKAKVYRDMGIIYYNFKQEYEKAITCFRKSLELNPDNIKTYAGLVMCLLKLRQFDEAVNVLDKATLKFPNSKEIQNMKNIVSQMRTH